MTGICSERFLFRRRLKAAFISILSIINVSAVTAGIVSTVGTTDALAAPDPRIHWDVLETPHFIILHDSRHYLLAQQYARFSEQAFAATATFFNNETPDKTVVVIDDSTDIANGFATGVPYPLIGAFPVLPVVLDSIADYGNWGLELMTHEFTHIATFEPAHGLARPLRMLFGSILRPNMILPRWYLEGLAVQMETRLSRHGRLRSVAAMSVPRAMAIEDKLREEDIARLNETGIPDGVGGLRPYLLGGLLWNHMVKSGGENIIADLNSDYSRRIPFFINGPVESRLGLDYTALLTRAYGEVSTRAKKHAEQIRASGETPTRKLKQDGIFNHSPSISPDGQWMIYIARTLNQDDRLELLDRGARPQSQSQGSFADGTKKVITKGTLINRASWLPNSIEIVYDKIDTFDRYYQYSDLYRVDIKTRKTQRITKGLRAREPVVGPDGKTIVFVQTLPGTTRLARVDVSGANFKILYEPKAPQTRLSRPEFISPKDVIFAEKDATGVDGFKVISLSDGTTRDVLTKFRPVSFARWTKDGLLFASGISGIENLYLSDRKLRTARPITNIQTRAMTGEIDPRTHELYFSLQEATGPFIHVVAGENWASRLVQPPKIGSLLDYQWPKFESPKVEVPEQRYEYSPWRYMYPRYWIPFVYFIPGGTFASATTSANDPLGKHAYSLQASFDTLSNGPSFGGVYINSQTRTTLSAQASVTREYVYSGDFIRQNTFGALSAGFPLSRQNDKWQGSLSFQYLQTEFLDRLDSRAGPYLSIAYGDVSQKGMQISPERGGSVQLAYTNYLNGLGTITYDKTDFLGSFYFSKWLPEHHAFSLRFNATTAPNLPSIFLGQTTSAADYGTLLFSSDFMMRGYANGSFIGKTMLNSSLEYRFPVWYTYKGSGTFPGFIQRLHAALFVDAVTLDGAFYDETTKEYRSAKLGRYFLGTGLEARMDMTAFYHLPLRAVFGLYYGTDRQAGLGVTPFVGLSL